MTKALLKKQMLEVFAWVYQDKKTGKRRSKKGLIGFAVLYIILFGYLGVIFYGLASILCAPLVGAGFGWLYMALMGLLAVSLGVFGSVFNTFSTLYKAKDNDLLLSMPVPVNHILFARLLGVYAMGLMYELLVIVPAIIVYFTNTPFDVLSLLFCLLIPFVLSFFILSLSCILGWVVAVVSSRLKNQKIITVVLSLGFIGAYYYLCGNMSTLMQSIMQNPGGLGSKMKGALYPLYHMGKAAEGNVLSMVIFTGILFAIFAAVYLVLRRSFLKLATTNLGSKKVKYVEKKAESRSVAGALLFKEFRRFFGSTNYMLNCGLGIIFMPLAAVLLIVKQSDVRMLCELIGYNDFIALIACAAICMITAMNDMSAPSVSLEGKNIWILQVLPVSGWEPLRAKLSMHLILTLIPAMILTVCVEFVIQPPVLFVILMPLIVALFVLLMAVLGLVCNLKMPNLNWSSEVIPIKQSASVGIALFGGWVIVLVLGGLYYFLSDVITPAVFAICVSILLAAVSIALLRWLKTKGSRIFAEL